MVGQGCHGAVKIHPLVCVTPENSIRLEDVLGTERRGRAGTIRDSEPELHCSSREQDVILPAQMPFKSLMPERRRWEDLLLSLVCLSAPEPGKAGRESGFTALLTPGMNRVLNLPALQAQRDKLAQDFLHL